MVIDEKDLKVGFYEFLKSGFKKEEPPSPPLEDTPVKFTGSELYIIDFIKFTDGSFGARGYVYNDSRWTDTTEIRTSRIESIDWVKKELKTLNTLYKIRM